jgi:hypothetical protein
MKLFYISLLVLLFYGCGVEPKIEKPLVSSGHVEEVSYKARESEDDKKARRKATRELLEGVATRLQEKVKSSLKDETNYTKQQIDEFIKLHFLRNPEDFTKLSVLGYSWKNSIYNLKGEVEVEVDKAVSFMEKKFGVPIDNSNFELLLKDLKRFKFSFIEKRYKPFYSQNFKFQTFERKLKNKFANFDATTIRLYKYFLKDGKYHTFQFIRNGKNEWVLEKMYPNRDEYLFKERPEKISISKFPIPKVDFKELEKAEETTQIIIENILIHSSRGVDGFYYLTLDFKNQWFISDFGTQKR